MRILRAVLLMVTAHCCAQVSSTVSLSNGVQLRLTGTPSPLKIEMAAASGNSFYRILRDENNLAVFAYELAVDRTPDGEQFRISAKPAGLEFAARFPNADGGKPTPTLSEVLQSPLLSDGGQFSVDIPTDPAINGGHLTDTAQIQVSQRGVSASEAEAPSSQLSFSRLSVSINGRRVSPRGTGASGVAGRYAMFYLPGHGAYFFSTEPVEQRPFVHIGTVDHATLQFTLDNDSYTCRSDAPILPHSDRGELWVYHDPNYKPVGNWTKSDFANPSREEFFTAASDSLNWWLP